MPKRKRRREAGDAINNKDERIHWTRDGRRRPIKCNQCMHAAGCRPGRPLCWRMRQVNADKYGVCECGTYPFPHRRGSCAAKERRLADEEEKYLREKAELEDYRQGMSGDK